MMRPHITVVLAMSADGKIADFLHSPARFGSAADRAHLETQIAKADGVLFGAQTLRAYGTTLRLTNPILLQQRQQEGKSAQPIHMVCSRSAQLDPNCPFFRQEVPRWLITTPKAATEWQDRSHFDRILTPPLLSPHNLLPNHSESQDNQTNPIFDWSAALAQLTELGLDRLVVSGGGQLIASLLQHDLIDEFWLTVCPLILGGTQAPTPVAGAGFLASLAPRLELLSVQTIDQEVFLHYRLQRKKN